MISGHITICKIYKDGHSEVVLDQKNMITAGLGAGVCDLLGDGGSLNADNYRPGYFQLGTSGMGLPATDASSYFYHLSSPLSWEQYGIDSNLEINQLRRGFFVSTTDTIITTTSIYDEVLFTIPALSSTAFSGTNSGNSYFAKTNPAAVTKWYFDSIESEIVLDETTANGQTITEVGLFSKNPKGYNKDTQLLMAYKSFVGLSPALDTKFHPTPENETITDTITYSETI